ncbi:MAG: aspartate/glutamate racemase family protein [Lentilitoribacter sp.]
MDILVINPNTTASMTTSIGVAAKEAAADSTEIISVNPVDGPKSIQGSEDGQAALPGLFEVFDEKSDAHDAVIIACFDDTGLVELRARASMPVIGIGEAAFHVAMLLGLRFSVVTTLDVSVPVIQGNLESYGFDQRCAKVRASGIPVLDLEADDHTVKNTLRDEIARAFDEDDIDSVVLGCAGMAKMAAELTQEFGKPVIDGVQAAVQLCEITQHHSVRSRSTSPLESVS